MPQDNPVATKRLYAGGLAIGTTVLLGILFLFLPQLERSLAIEAKVTWENKSQLSLRSGPSWFVYDTAEKVLKSGRSINDNAKRQLLALVDGTNDATYQEAIDKLAYASNQSANSAKTLALILTLGVLSGILGVLIRSLSSFVFHACFLKDLDLATWWPWYVLRPFLGAAVGVTLIVLLKSKLMNFNEPEEFAGFWLLGLCILAGFGVDEFVNRLFYLARTLFGEEGNTRPENAKPTTQPASSEAITGSS